MKKFLLFILLLFYIINIYSQNYNDSVLTIIERKNIINISFRLPNYNIIDTNLTDLYGITEDFNYITVNESFGIVDSISLPELPQLSFDLKVPNNASDLTISLLNSYTNQVYLDYKIMPSQENYSLIDTIFNFKMDTNYYLSYGGFINNNALISEEFVAFGEKGLCITIFPFIYNPMLDLLTVLDSAKIQISYSTKGQITDNYYSDLKNDYLGNFFKNYAKQNTNSKGRYLIIVPPLFENAITYFANYKRNIGYSVDLISTTNTGITVNSIKNYIQQRYNNLLTRPDFILLVGDVNKIPAYEGDASGNDINNPISDLGYSLLNGNDNIADVFLGRFSISDTIKLTNVINKTIFMETNWHRFEKKAKFLAGDEYNWNSHYMKQQFEKGHNYVIPYSFEYLGYNCQKLYQPNQTSAINALNDNPLFYIYSGHGAYSELFGISFNIDKYDIPYLNNTVFPVTFAFACQTGNFSYPYSCIGEDFIGAKDKGAVAYFGSSVNTATNSDVVIEKKIFGDAFRGDTYLSMMLNNGMRRFSYSYISNTKKKRYLKAYNLLGDPSLNIKGTSCMNNIVFNNTENFPIGAKVTYRASNNIETNNVFIIKSEANIKLIAEERIILREGFHVEHGANFTAKIADCNNIIIKSLNKNDDETVNIIPENLINPIEFSVFPNPTNGDVSICYTLENESSINIDIYNMSGILAKKLINISKKQKGTHYYNFSIKDLPPATYIISLKTNDKIYSYKIIKN